MIKLLLPGLLMMAGPAAPAADLLPSDPVLRTLLEGDAAEGMGNHGALLDTAQILAALGAKPADGQPQDDGDAGDGAEEHCRTQAHVSASASCAGRGGTTHTTQDKAYLTSRANRPLFSHDTQPSSWDIVAGATAATAINRVASRPAPAPRAQKVGSQRAILARRVSSASNGRIAWGTSGSAQ